MILTGLTVAAYVVVASAVAYLVQGVVRTRRARPTPVGAPDADDLWEAAFLAGGPGRVADLVLCSMHTDKRIKLIEPGVVTVKRVKPRHPVEGEVVAAHARSPYGSLGWLRGEVMRSPTVQQIGDALAARGLMVRPGVGDRWHLRCRAVKYACLALAVIAMVSTFGSDSPWTLLAALLPPLLLGALAAFGCQRALGRRVTRAGRTALTAYARSRGVARNTSTTSKSRIAVRGTAVMEEKVSTLLREAARRSLTAQPAAGAAATGAAAAGAAVVVWCGTALEESVRTSAAGKTGGWSGSGSGGNGTGGCATPGGCGLSSCGVSSGSGGGCGGGSACGGGGGGGGGGCGGGGGGGCGGGGGGCGGGGGG